MDQIDQHEQCLDQVLCRICRGPSGSKFKLEIANYVIKKDNEERWCI